MNEEFRSISKTCEGLIPNGHACATLYLEQHTIQYDLLLALQGSHLSQFLDFFALNLTDHCYQYTIQSHCISFQSMSNFHECAESVMCLRVKRYRAKRRNLRLSTSQTLPITRCFKINKCSKTQKNAQHTTFWKYRDSPRMQCYSIFRCTCKIAKSEYQLSVHPSAWKNAAPTR